MKRSTRQFHFQEPKLSAGRSRWVLAGDDSRMVAPRKLANVDEARPSPPAADCIPVALSALASAPLARELTCSTCLGGTFEFHLWKLLSFYYNFMLMVRRRFVDSRWETESTVVHRVMHLYVVKGATFVWTNSIWTLLRKSQLCPSPSANWTGGNICATMANKSLWIVKCLSYLH